MNNIRKGIILKISLFADFTITFFFGIASLIYPYLTFGTIVSFKESDGPVMLAAFSGLSTMYILIGIVCFLAAKSPPRQQIWFSALMTVRHLWIGVMGFKNSDASWVIGNPWPDIVIHSAFVLAYVIGIYFSYSCNDVLTKTSKATPKDGTL